MAGLLVAAVVVGIVLIGGGHPYELTLRLQNASQLVKGDEVKVGGVAVGKVKDIRLADDNLAEVDITVTDKGLTPLHAGTRAEIRQSSLSSIANRFVQLEPGPNNAPTLKSGSTLSAESTQSVVEIDSVLNTLDAATRSAAQRVLRDGAAVYSGQEAAANRGLAALDPAVSRLDALASELDRDQGALQGFLVDTAAVVSTVASRNPDLERALTGSAATARELADERATLADALHRAPGTLAVATDTLRRLGTTFDALRPTAAALRPVAPQTATLVSDLQPLLRNSHPAITSLRGVLGPLAGALRGLPAVRTAADPAFAATERTVDAALPILRAALPYLPDVFHGIVSHFGNLAVASYDANGAYARIAPVVTQFSATGALSNLTSAPVTGSRKGETSRCRGGAYHEVPDSVNDTPSPGVSCDPGQAP